MSTNHNKLSTFSGTIDTKGALFGAFEAFKDKAQPEHLSEMIDAVKAAGHAFQGADDERATFDCFPGLGRAAVTASGYDHMSDEWLWEVVVHHPAMGRGKGKGEIHTCTTIAEVLAVLATVSYG